MKNRTKDIIKEWLDIDGYIQKAIKILMEHNYITIDDIVNSIYYIYLDSDITPNDTIIYNICRNMLMEFINEHNIALYSNKYSIENSSKISDYFTDTSKIKWERYFGLLFNTVRNYNISYQELWDILTGKYNHMSRNAITIFKIIEDIRRELS